MAPSLSVVEQIAIAANAAVDKAGFDLVALDVSDPLPIVGGFLLVSGRSERNVIAISDEIEAQLLIAGIRAIRREGRAEGRWVLLDFGDIICHVFSESERLYYGLERLWKDCPTLPLPHKTPQHPDDFGPGVPV